MGELVFTPAERRFWANVVPTGFCWEWTGYHDRKGYGRTKFHGRHTPAHRAVYELLVGLIPEGLQLDHLCLNTGCVNPDHLDPVTVNENVRRMVDLKISDTCINGHARTERDTLVSAAGVYRDHIRCRQCLLVRSHQAAGINCTYDEFCTNPTHLDRDWVSPTCIHGHSLEDAYVRRDGGGRMCRVCHRERERARQSAARSGGGRK